MDEECARDLAAGTRGPRHRDVRKSRRSVRRIQQLRATARGHMAVGWTELDTNDARAFASHALGLGHGGGRQQARDLRWHSGRIVWFQRHMGVGWHRLDPTNADVEPGPTQAAWPRGAWGEGGALRRHHDWRTRERNLDLGRN